MLLVGPTEYALSLPDQSVIENHSVVQRVAHSACVQSG
jgi:hypothetical protein